MLLRHTDVWRAIDRLARANGLSPSGLARAAGLDPTTFNRSKRVSAEGKRRWPSTESLAKALSAVGATPLDFLRLASGETLETPARLPLIAASAMAGAAGAEVDERGRPQPLAAGRAAETLFPGLDDPGAFALELDLDPPPPYRRGDLLIVSPAAHLRTGDAVAVGTRTAGLHVGRLAEQAAGHVRLEPDRRIASETIAWMSRVVWASQ